jgi:hypothetical protein
VSAHGSPFDRLGLFGNAVPYAFTIRVVVVAPFGEHVYDAAEWSDALVEVEHGDLDVELRDGDRCHFGSGDVLWLVGLPISRLHNPGQEPTVLVAVSRR